MKLRLSELVEDDEQDVRLSLPDAQMQARIRDMALTKAGLIERTARRSIGKRAALTLLAALVLLALFTTTLAATDLGPQLADMFRDHEGISGMLDAVGLFGSAVGSHTTAQDITVCIDAAYSNDAESLLILSFDDEQGRLDQGMSFSPELTSGSLSPDSLSCYWPSITPDGKLHMLMSVDASQSYQGRNVRLSIRDIVPETSMFEKQSTGLTLGEALHMKQPFQIPGLQGVVFSDIHIEARGLVIAAQYPKEKYRNGFSLNEILLKYPDGQIADSDHAGTHYSSEFESTVTVERAFLGSEADMEKLMNCELLISYSQQAAPIEGAWTLTFRMPKGDSTVSRVPMNQMIGIRNWDYMVETAQVYSSCVTVDYRTVLPVDEMPRSEQPDGEHFLFDDWEYPMPVFRLVDENGTAISETAMMRWVEEDANGLSRYCAIAHCLTDQYEHIVLEILDSADEHVLYSQRLK